VDDQEVIGCEALKARTFDVIEDSDFVDLDRRGLGFLGWG